MSEPTVEAGVSKTHHDAMRRTGSPVAQQIAALYPGYFALVMATGIISIAAYLLGHDLIARSLLGVNLVAYAVLLVATGLRLIRFLPRVLADVSDHNRGPGFFTLVAGTAVLGRQLQLLAGRSELALVLWALAVFLWVLLSYSFLTAVTVRATKPLLATGLHGGWLIIVVATESVSLLAVFVAPRLPGFEQEILFFALATYLVGCILYVLIISLIFYRFTFIPFEGHALTPPYWINMGALAITTLAGTTLILHASEWPLLEELQPFLKGLTLLSWVTATWWIPLLVSLGGWRHVLRRVPLTYDPQYWGLVFPLGMYTVCTYQLAEVLHLPFLSPVPRYFIYAAYAAWALTFLGLLRRLSHLLDPVQEPAPDAAAGSRDSTSLSFSLLCPVHGVEARVQLTSIGTNEMPSPGACSLHPGEGDRPACDWRCIRLALEPKWGRAVAEP